MARAETRVGLPVRGTSCAACAGRLEQALRSVLGGREAAVTLATERAPVADDPQAVGLATFVDRVRAAGHEVPLVRLPLPVSGMSCAACVGLVEAALRGVPGVGEAVVNLAAEQVRVTLVGGRVAVADLRTAVRAAGYDLPEPAGSAEATGAAEAARAQEAAWRLRDPWDATLLADRLEVLVAAVALSRATLRVIRQNRGWGAFGDTPVLLPVAAGVRSPVFGPGGAPALLRPVLGEAGFLSPMLAGGAMACSCVPVATTSLRLRRFAPPSAGTASP